MNDDNNVEDWLQTFTGKKFRIFNPTEDMIDLERYCTFLIKYL